MAHQTTSDPSGNIVASSTSSNSGSLNYQNYSYDVFINHRGPDVKNTFASHLYYRLISHGLRAFLDREELQEGENLTSQIEAAIRNAYLHIAIFSPTYAESKWCLDELVLMLKSGATIIPVVYNVKPSELRWADRAEVYFQTLRLREETGRYDAQTLENWRKALVNVSSLSGFELEAYNGDEGKLLDKLVQSVLRKPKKPALNVAKYPIGLEEKVQDFEQTLLLQHPQRSGKTRVVGIVGLGGAGKTTLAKEFFNRKSSDYDGSCFLFDVRENAARRSLHVLQCKLIKELARLDQPVDNIDEGIGKLRRYVSSSHSLVILDDVDHVNQLEAFPMKDILHSGSLIVVTSRSKDVLTRSGIVDSSIYKLTGLSKQHSQELFCSHAFCRPHPSPGFGYLVNEYVTACDGLPLSLKVFGGLLCGKDDKTYWKDQLDRLHQTQIPAEIQQKLKISYDALDPLEQQIFLDIACFFTEEDRDTAIRIWDGSGWKGLLGFSNLENKCLIEVDSGNRIKMHAHLRDLGRDIADQAKASGLMPIRLWRSTNSIEDVFDQISIIEARGIKTFPHYGHSLCPEVSWNQSMPIENIQICFRKLQLLASEGDMLEGILRRVRSPNLIWLRWYKCPYSCLPSWMPMVNLSVLQVEGRKLKILWPSESQAPLKLRELRIIAPLSNFPKSIGQLKHLEKIVVDSLQWTLPQNVIHLHLKYLPEEFCQLRSLKHLELRGCSAVESLPDSFGHLTNLQHIDLTGCHSLQMLPDSFGNLIRLKHLCLRDCYNLTISSKTLGNIITLECLILSGCHKIEVLPPQVTYQRSLKELVLAYTNFKELPSGIGDLSKLEILELGSPLEVLPPSLGYLRCLKTVRLDHCEKLKCLHDSFGLLTQLSTLSIESCGISYLTSNMVKMNNLQRLSIWDCPLRRLPFEEVERIRVDTLTDPIRGRLMYRLEYLLLFRTEISEISFPWGVCSNLKYLNISYCHSLVDVGALPTTLLSLHLIGCSELKKIRGLCDLSNLQDLDISECPEVETLPNFEMLTSLEKFRAIRCVKLKRIRGLSQMTNLRVIDVAYFWALNKLEGVEHLRLLEELHIVGYNDLQCSGVREYWSSCAND